MATITVAFPFILAGFCSCTLLLVGSYFYIKSKSIIDLLVKGMDVHQFIKEKLDQKSTLIEIENEILFHFDTFMQTKLTKALPVLDLFIDDKLIAELKTVFATEMKLILPEVLSNHVQKNGNKILQHIHLYLNAKMQKRLLKILVKYILISLFISAIVGIIITLFII